MPPVRKFASLQILRALAAWAVVFHHYMQWYFGYRSTTLFGFFFTQYGSMGVDVFFVLSGFVVFLMAEKSPQGPLEFLINRFFRIAPTYWFYCAVVVLCISIFPRGFEYTSYNAKSILTTLLFLPSWNPTGLGIFPVLVVGWTLNYEIFFYVALAACMAISRRHFFMILFCAFTVLPLIYPNHLYYGNIAGSTKLWEFLAGALLSIAWRSRGVATFVERRNVLVAAYVILIFLSTVLLQRTFGEHRPLAISVVLLALIAERYVNPDSKVVQWLVKLGDESYSTYLVHGIVLGIIIHVTGTNLRQPAQMGALLCYAVSVYGVSVASYQVLERSRYIAKLQNYVVSKLVNTGRVIARKEDQSSVSH